MGSNIALITVAGEGDRVAYQKHIWNRIQNLALEHNESISSASLLSCYPDTDSFRLELYADCLVFHFGNPASYITRSAEAWRHWTTCILAAKWDEFQGVARSYNLAIVSQRPTMAEALDSGGPLAFIYDDVWLVDPDGLCGDGDNFIPFKNLDNDVRDCYEMMLKSCECGICTELGDCIPSC